MIIIPIIYSFTEMLSKLKESIKGKLWIIIFLSIDSRLILLVFIRGNFLINKAEFGRLYIS